MMKKLIKKRKLIYLLPVVLTVFLISLPSQSSAAATDRYNNPSEYNNFGEIIQSIAEFFAYIAFPLAAIMIIYTGIKFLLAQGNEQKISEAKETFRWVFIGAVIVIGAFAIVLTLRNLF